ncbi:hypothetical protein FB45DRAFT_869054 [Roridomyces roridus]|uniref:F-box domain-containing protein n=1 Tax=Roridomyces roridus TaxID=1738132 RepID=A0AAD7BNS8_9AGAR|nr:hypothetical protein FB45DRAFT_869054 [Roridomyces roridus]
MASWGPMMGCGCARRTTGGGGEKPEQKNHLQSHFGLSGGWFINRFLMAGELKTTPYGPNASRFKSPFFNENNASGTPGPLVGGLFPILYTIGSLAVPLRAGAGVLMPIALNSNAGSVAPDPAPSWTFGYINPPAFVCLKWESHGPHLYNGPSTRLLKPARLEAFPSSSSFPTTALPLITHLDEHRIMKPATRHNLRIPIARLPTEILGKVFQNLLTAVGPPRTIYTLFLLAQVCSKWRAICINTPIPWTHPYFHRSDSESPLSREFTSVVLARSGFLPVSASFDLMRSREQWKRPSKALFEYRPLLHVQVANRLQHLSLTLEPADLKERPPFTPFFPNLASISITLSEYSKPALKTLERILLRACPSVTTFFLKVVEEDEDNQPDYIPTPPMLQQLTSLTLLVPLLEDDKLYDMLAQCVRLDELQIEDILETGLGGGPRILTLPALRSLTYKPSDGGYGDILRLLRLPRLQSLTLSSYPSQRWPALAIVVEDVYQHVPFDLRHLSLNGVGGNTEQLSEMTQELVRLLRVTGNLQTLVLEDIPCIADVFPLLTAGSQPQVRAGLMLPRLGKLSIRHNSDEVEGGAVVQMVYTLGQHCRNPRAPFPAICLVQLDLHGGVFDAGVEDRLAHMERASPGFFENSGMRYENEDMDTDEDEDEMEE